MALKLSGVTTYGKTDVFRFDPRELVTRFAAYTGRKDRSPAAIDRMAASLPGARVLEGRWGIERFALAIPASREAGLAFVQRFSADAEREGLVDRAVEAAGLRGVVPPGTR